MKKLMLNVYEIDELQGKAKQRALEDAREVFAVDSQDIKDYLFEQLQHEYRIKGLDVRFNLSYSQGDGVAFTGTVDLSTVKGFSDDIDKLINGEYTPAHVNIHGSYTHYNSMSVTVEDHKDSDKLEEAFLEILKQVSKDLTSDGYDYIESMESDDAIIENCKANDIYFLASGEIAPKGEYLESGN